VNIDGRPADDTGMGFQRIACTHEDCTRQFIDQAALHEHAEAVHTFGDLQRLVGDTVREKFGRKYDRLSQTSAVYTYVVDLAEDWAVFEAEGEGGSGLFKVTYAIADGVVTLGDPVEVRRRTVYEPVKKQDA
jgi:hypothetical protein